MTTVKDPRDFALTALANMVRLLAAELVAGCHRDDVDRLEQAVRAKIGDTIQSGDDPETAAEGLHLARTLIEEVLAKVRAQADRAHAVDISQEERRSLPPRLLN